MLKKAFAIILCIVSVLSICTAVTVYSFAADSTSYSSYDTPESSGDYAYWNGSKVVKSSSTTVSEIKWIQAALNYCIKNRGLSASTLTVDGSFGPASKKTTLAFQKKYGLTQDGSFGPACITKMKSVLSSGSSSSTNVTAESDWLWPSSAKRTTCGFADNVYHTSHWHRGIDIPCSIGTDVYASKSGTVACVGKSGDRGNYIIIDHGNGYYSEYQHLDKTLKSKGTKVTRGDVIAKSGDTGSGGKHLHFEIWNLGKAGKSISNAEVPWNNYGQYVNVNPKNTNKIYCSKSNDYSAGLKIGQKQGSSIAKAALVKSGTSAGSGLVYCSDTNGINYIFK